MISSFNESIARLAFLRLPSRASTPFALGDDSLPHYQHHRLSERHGLVPRGPAPRDLHLRTRLRVLC